MVVLQNVSPPSEGVRHEQTDITAVLDGKGLGPGTLCVAETRVSWFDGSGVGFSLEYPSISLHAISRDLSTYPEEHLYVMVNSKYKEQGQIDLPTYYSFEEGMSQLTAEGQATLDRLEGMLAQASDPQHRMAGVRTHDAADAVNVEEPNVVHL
uniref:Methylosome subunit pICln n=1 Tax=Electrophorus electricus TaxID=8005 RepID=A0A4W4F721_ELEEL